MTGSPRVLIVDDEERFRTTLCKLLVVKGVDAKAVGSGKEALNELDINPYDVVLLDVKMPEMNGIEALAELKKAHRTVEVIMLTGHGTVETAIEGMRLGAYDYLMKPSDTQILITKITKAHQRKIEHEERIRQAEGVRL